MKKKAFCLVILFILITLLTACGHEHIWTDATCTTPKICSECGETEGESLGHDLIPASCDAAEICSRCGETFGSRLEHEWQEATCTAPETCIFCGRTQGKVLDHNWYTENLSIAECLDCGETTKYTDIIQSYFPLGRTDNFDPDTGCFSITAEEFLNNLLPLPEGYVIATIPTPEGYEDTPEYALTKSSNIDSDGMLSDPPILVFCLVDDKDIVIDYNDNTSNVFYIYLTFLSEAKYAPEIAPFVYSMTYLCNPSYSFRDFIATWNYLISYSASYGNPYDPGTTTTEHDTRSDLVYGYREEDSWSHMWIYSLPGYLS